jgi:hypothetical protein
VIISTPAFIVTFKPCSNGSGSRATREFDATLLLHSLERERVIKVI